MIRRRRRGDTFNREDESSSYNKNLVLAVLFIYTLYVIFLSSSFSLAPSHHHHQKTLENKSPLPLSTTRNVASVRACLYSPFFDPVFHAYVVSSKGDIISPLEIRRSVKSKSKWVLASSSSSRTISSPIRKSDAIVLDKRNDTDNEAVYEIFIDIHFEPISMSEKHTVKLFVSYSSMAESLRDYPFANAMTYNELRRTNPTKHASSAPYLGIDTSHHFRICDSSSSSITMGVLEPRRRVFSFMWHPLSSSVARFVNPPSAPLNFCVSTDDITSDGYWSSSSSQWHPRHCKLKRRSPAATRACLRRVSLTFVGDSLVGQVSEFLRSGLSSCVAEKQELLRCDDPIWPDVVPDEQSYVEMCRKNQTNPCMVRENLYVLSLIHNILLLYVHIYYCTYTRTHTQDTIWL